LVGQDVIPGRADRLLKNPPRSFRDAAISAFTRVFDALWRRTRNPEKQEIPMFWIPGSPPSRVQDARERA